MIIMSKGSIKEFRAQIQDGPYWIKEQLRDDMHPIVEDRPQLHKDIIEWAIEHFRPFTYDEMAAAMKKLGHSARDIQYAWTGVDLFEFFILIIPPKPLQKESYFWLHCHRAVMETHKCHAAKYGDLVREQAKRTGEIRPKTKKSAAQKDRN